MTYFVNVDVGTVSNTNKLTHKIRHVLYMIGQIQNTENTVTSGVSHQLSTEIQAILTILLLQSESTNYFLPPENFSFSSPDLDFFFFHSIYHLLHNTKF